MKPLRRVKQAKFTIYVVVRNRYHSMARAIGIGSMPSPISAFKQTGFSYISLLLMVAISGIGLAMIGQVWHTEAQREKEKELLFIGEEFSMALASYAKASVGSSQYPR